MFGTIRRHQTWLWVVIITLTVISFVVYFNPNQRSSRAQAGYGRVGVIDETVITPEDFNETRLGVALYYRLTRGEWPDRDPQAKQLGFDEERETWYRLLMREKMRQMNIHVSNDAAGQLAADIVRGFQRAGVNSLQDFEKAVLSQHNPPLTLADFDRFVRHELGVQQLISVLSLSGRLITPAVAASLFRRENELLVTEAAVFSATNYMAGVTVTPEALGQFYTNRMSLYRLPERVQVSYVKWELTNFLADADAEIAKITNFNALVEAEYLKLGTNYFSDAKTPEEARERIKLETRNNFALAKARAPAVTFADAVMSMEPVKVENFDTVAATNGLHVQVTPPFSEETGPVGVEVGADFVRAAFKVSLLDPFAGPIRGKDGVYVIAYQRRIPSENPPFDTIRDQVTSDFKFSEGALAAYSAGTNFYASLEAKMAAGESFSNACAEAGVAMVSLPPFALSSRTLPGMDDQFNLGQLQNIAFALPTGKASPFIPTRDGGFILTVEARIPVDDQRIRQELPGFVNTLRQTRQNEAFQEWFRKTATEGLANTALAQRQQQPGGAAPSR